MEECLKCKELSQKLAKAVEALKLVNAKCEGKNFDIVKPDQFVLGLKHYTKAILTDLGES